MNPEIILELAAKWDRDVKEYRDAPQDGAEAAEISNAKRAGGIAMKEKMARELRALVTILG